MQLSQSFRFLDLPDEVRLMTYNIAFDDMRVIHDLRLDRVARFYRSSRSLPQILRASKRIRSEALPVFARKLEPMFCNMVGYKPCPIPSYYLQHFRRITVFDLSTEVPQVEHMPQLSELVLQCHRNFDRYKVFPFDASTLEAGVLEVTDRYLLKEYCRGVEKKIGIGPNFKLLLDVIVRLESDQKPVVSPEKAALL